MEEVYQVMTKFLDGKTRLLSFTSPLIPVISIKNRIQQITSIPIHQQLLLSNGKQLEDGTLVPSNGPTVHLLLRLRGGKGGFGSLLRGAATKAGQKKTNNFDACRDMSGRRLRHVNAEKKMEEWRAEAEERKLEKIAEEFIKKKAKVAKKDGGAGDAAEKYVDKYRKDSAKCMEEVDRTVRESFGSFVSSKRKGSVVEANGSESKRLKIWMGKRKLNESDSDDTDEDDSDDEMGDKNEKSTVINNESNSDTNKDEEGSSGSVTGGKLDGELSAEASTLSGSEEEKETLANERSESPQIPNGSSLNGEADEPSGPSLKINEECTIQNKDISHVEDGGSSDGEINGNSEAKAVVVEETMPMSSNVAEAEKPLNFDEFSSAAEMEVLGMERLKSELQARGLKGGGTLAERAARLFLLKTTPVEKLPKKLLAKK